MPGIAMWLIAIIRRWGRRLLPSGVHETFVRRFAGNRDVAWKFMLQEGGLQAPGVWDGLPRTTGQAQTRCAVVSRPCLSSFGVSLAQVAPPLDKDITIARPGSGHSSRLRAAQTLWVPHNAAREANISADVHRLQAH
jgi:hypothetical protein